MNSRQDCLHFPRQLTHREREFLTGILPLHRIGYREYFNLLDPMVVIGEGRRGAGELILGNEHETPDFDFPLAPVFAYGAVETNFGTISITAREFSQGQASIEIVNNRTEHVPAEFEESRRWTYSTWEPGKVCPKCLQSTREVGMKTGGRVALTLALCPGDQRLWVYEHDQQVVRLIPVTNFYNELMLMKNIRDPKIALDSKLLFSGLSGFTDIDLARAFETYNKVKTKVHLQGSLSVNTKQPAGVLSTLKRLFIS